MTGQVKPSRLAPDVLVVAVGGNIYVRRGPDLVVLQDLGSEAIEAVRDYGLDAITHLALGQDDSVSIRNALHELGCLACTDDSDDGRSRGRDCRPLVEVLASEAIASTVEEIARLGACVMTADEALMVPPSCSPREVLRAIRMFVSRLDWFRLSTYASVMFLPPETIQVVGDESALPPPTILGASEAAEPRIRAFAEVAGGWALTGTGPAGSMPPAGVAAEFGDRLSAVSVRDSDAHVIATVGGEPLWLAIGEFALPNLRFTGLPSREGRLARWCMGADQDRTLAIRKAAAEGVERFVMGDIPADDLLHVPANELEGSFLDPSEIAKYSRNQEQRHGIEMFDDASEEWWVSGICMGSPVWLPAALVFCPFDGGQKWLLPGYSSSNGAAAHVRPELATRAAWRELVERDAIMRTWLQGIPPARLSEVALDDSAREFLQSLRQRFDEVELILMYSSIGSPVVGACGWDRGRFCLGAAAASVVSVAATKALTEMLIQLSSSFAGTLPAPEEVRTPEDHGRLYARPEVSQSVRWLIEGEPAEPAIWDDEADAAVAYYFVREVGDWYVSRALDPRLIALTFGWDNELLGHPAARRVLREEWRGSGSAFPHPLA